MTTIDEHRDIILKALRDYRRWWVDDGPDDTQVREIDEAIEFMRDV